MTFSANPARTTLRQRLGRLPGPRRALLNVVIAALLVMAAGVLLALFLVRAVVSEQAAQFGNALAAESAQRASEYLVHDDLVSLNVITASLTRLPGVVGVTVLDRHRQPLAQSGRVSPTPDTLLAVAHILTEDRELRGSVELLIDPRAVSPALARFDYTMFGWLGFAAVLLLVVVRLQRNNLAGLPAAAAAPAAPVATVAETGAVDGDEDGNETGTPAALPAGAVLRLDVVNLATLEQRLSPRILAETVAWYDDVLARAAAIYQGQVVRNVDNHGLVLFPAGGTDDDELLFRAICCAQLFFGVVRETGPERKARGHVALQFSAALHHDPQLDDDDRALITWEICTQAGVAGRLTVTDAISDHPVLGERLVIDGQNRQLLQIELPTHNEEVVRLQDVLALGVVRLADPYEELLSRQVRRLCEPAAA